MFASLLLWATPWSAAAIGDAWPDPNKHPRVIVYADQTLEDYLKQHPRWFKDDFLVLGLNINQVIYGQSDCALRKYDFLRNQLRFKGIVSTAAVSGTTALHELSLSHTPADAVSIEDLPVRTRYLGKWLRQPEQQIVDLRDPLSQKALAHAIEDLWQHSHGPLRFVDNAAVHPSVVPLLPWASYCKQMKDLRLFAESFYNHVVFNVFARPWQMTDQEMKQLIDAVAGRGRNGISLPLPWSRALKKEENGIANKWAIYRYRQLLNHKIAVILIPSDEANAEELFDWLATWRAPGDNVYVAMPFWKNPNEP